jgi:hypothetical protein
VEALAENDVWAVGSSSASAPSRTVILHWDGTAWTQVPSPNPGIDPNGGNYLESIHALSSDNIWAVGAYEGSAGNGSLTLHWDGTAWTHVQAPSIGWLTGVSGSAGHDVWAIAPPITSTLSALHWDGWTWSMVDLPEPEGDGPFTYAISSPSQNDVWAVGITGDLFDSTTLVERYVGTCQTVTPTPNLTPPPPTLTPTSTPTPLPDGCMWVWDSMENPSPEDTNAFFMGIEALSPTDIWAVGSAGEMLIENWNGSQWTVMPPPGVITEGVLSDVSGLAVNDVWAVGHKYTSNSYTPAAFHWNGVQWADVPVPTEPGLNQYLFAVEPISANNVWAVGWTSQPTKWGQQALVMHWDGASWTSVPISTTAPYSALYGISASSPNDIWAVGYRDEDSVETLVMHWNGATWTEVSTGVETWVVLRDVEALSDTNVWAVGHAYVDNAKRAVILRWDGSQWTAPVVLEDAYLEGIDALGSNDIWAVGGTTLRPDGGILMRWDGSQWSQSPVFDSWAGIQMYSVAIVSPTEVWTAGESIINSPHRALAARYSVRCPEPVACQPGWNITPSLDPDPRLNYLGGVDASASDNVWAVGKTRYNGALVKRWDGETWQLMPPAPVVSSTTLLDVRVFSPNEVWAVGNEDHNPLPRSRPRKGEEAPQATAVILRWDGSQWHRFASPGWGNLTDIDGVAPNDLWAVGYNGQNSFILYWNGSIWSERLGGPGILYSVKAVATNDVWAVGHTGNETLTLHWDGSQWTRVPSPSPSATINHLNSVDATGPNDVWAVGEADMPNITALVLRWNGGQWTEVPTPGSFLLDVSALASNDVWALQWGDSPVNAARVIRWNGTQWTVHNLPPPPTQPWSLEGLVAVSSNEVWAVGGLRNLALADRSLIERYVGTCQTVTPTPIQTSTATPSASRTGTRTPTPTHTATLPPGITATPSPTPTACTLAFADVPPTNTFYPFVRCLACRGIISGYQCGGAGEPCNPSNDPYFRPNNYVTRGQLAKIVSESAGFSEEVPPSRWTFTDVPYGSTFWVWVERLADREVMAGYPCGGANEPCDDQDRPYFRPGNGATRGQLTKIVSNAAGFSDTIPPGQYTFADVTPTHTFWLFVERLLLNRPEVMAGYDCGGEGEPCDAETRPYFRPNNPLTRGQTSKIVANTFFPGCDPPRR